MRKLGLSMVLGSPILFPFCPSLVTRISRGMPNGYLTSSNLDPSEAEKGLHSRVIGGWKLVVTKPFHVRVLETLPLSSCSCDPGSYPQVLFLLNPVGSIFFLILEVVSILPLNLLFFLRDSRVCFHAFQQRT